jgi:hypothetical protein
MYVTAIDRSPWSIRRRRRWNSGLPSSPPGRSARRRVGRRRGATRRVPGAAQSCSSRGCGAEPGRRACRRGSGIRRASARTASRARRERR